jgi:hypothetical protein
MAAHSLQPGGTPANALSRRGILGALAAAPLLALPSALAASGLGDFEAALRTYLAAKDADERDSGGGALQAAYDLYDERTAWLRAKYQYPSSAQGEDRRIWDLHWGEMSQAEEAHAEIFSRPRWSAFDRLKATPAPTAAPEDRARRR